MHTLYAWRDILGTDVAIVVAGAGDGVFGNSFHLCAVVVPVGCALAYFRDEPFPSIPRRLFPLDLGDAGICENERQRSHAFRCQPRVLYDVVACNRLFSHGFNRQQSGGIQISPQGETVTGFGGVTEF